jgi:hypothetical protein
MKKTQISIEYIILTGFILLVLIVPTVIYLQRYAGGGIFDSVNQKKANELGHGIVKTAQDMYYLGIYSKKIVSYDVPRNVQLMFIMNMTMQPNPAQPPTTVYYLAMYMQGEKDTVKKFYFQSDVPIRSEGSNMVPCTYGEPQPPGVIIGCSSGFDISQCTEVGTNTKCSFDIFTDPSSYGTTTITPGTKDFKVEVKQDSSGKIASVITYEK